MHHKNIAAGGLLVTTALLLAAAPLQLAAAPPQDQWRQRLARSIPQPEDVEVVRSDRGVAATLNVEASEAAVAIMEAGGNAIDAAAAAWLVMGVVTPNQTGLGAGGYITYYDAQTGQTYFLDGNVRAPAAAHPGVFVGAGNIRAQGMAVGVPGLLRGFDVALKRWGSKYFDELAQPAIRLAADGWEVDRELSLRIHQMQGSLQEYARNLYVPDGEPLQPGSLLVQPEKARALRLIAEEGPDAFYQGPIADAVAAHVQGLGGFLTAEDFHRYNASVHQPLWVPYKDYWVATNPNIAGGKTLGMLLRLVEPFDLGQYPVRSAERYHLLLEAIRVASAQSTAHYADPEFVDRPWQALRSDEYVAARRAQIQADRRMDRVEPTDPWAFQVGGPYRTRGQHPGTAETGGEDGAGSEDWDEGTDHFTIADGHGNVVAVTSTLGTAWTAGHKVPEYGFMLNVTGAYFDTRPGGVHEIRPGKRPRSNMTPTLVLRDGAPVFTVGSPSPDGMQHVLVLLNLIDHGMELAEAIAEPRVAPSSTWEEGVPEEVLEQLRALGHPMNEQGSDRGAVSVVLRDGSGWLGAGDPRRLGVARAVGAARDDEAVGGSD